MKAWKPWPREIVPLLDKEFSKDRPKGRGPGEGIPPLLKGLECYGSTMLGNSGKGKDYLYLSGRYGEGKSPYDNHILITNAELLGKNRRLLLRWLDVMTKSYEASVANGMDIPELRKIMTYGDRSLESRFLGDEIPEGVISDIFSAVDVCYPLFLSEKNLFWKPDFVKSLFRPKCSEVLLAHQLLLMNKWRGYVELEREEVDDHLQFTAYTLHAFRFDIVGSLRLPTTQRLKKDGIVDCAEEAEGADSEQSLPNSGETEPAGEGGSPEAVSGAGEVGSPVQVHGRIGPDLLHIP